MKLVLETSKMMETYELLKMQVQIAKESTSLAVQINKTLQSCNDQSQSMVGIFNAT